MNKQTYQLINAQILTNAINHLRNTPLNPDKPYEVTIQERKRSNGQNRKMWPLLKDLADQVIWFGQKYDSDDWKDLITALVAKTKKQEQRTAPAIGGGIVMFGQRTSKMRVSEMVEVIEAIYWFGTENGVTFSEDSRLSIQWAERFGDSKRAA